MFQVENMKIPFLLVYLKALKLENRREYFAVGPAVFFLSALF